MKKFDQVLNLVADKITQDMYVSYMSGSNNYRQVAHADRAGQVLALSFGRRVDSTIDELNNLVRIKWDNRVV